MKITHFGEIILVTVLLASSLLVGLTSSASVYDPWCDLDEDGDIDIFDIVRMAGIYGTAGDPFEAKAALEYDSGWINITDMAGQYFNVTHNLNSTDSLVEITGKESSVSGPHQNDYGLTTHITTAPEWNHTYGGPNSDTGWSMIQTMVGAYVIAGYSESFGAGSQDMWLVKIDVAGNHLWNRTYGGTDYDWGSSVIQVDDGYVIAGGSYSFGSVGDSDFWLVKAYGPGEAPLIEVESGLAWTASTENTITLYRGEDDPYWNYVRVRIWKIRETP